MKCKIKMYFEECNNTAGFSIYDKDSQISILDVEPNTLPEGDHEFQVVLHDDKIYVFKMYGKDHKQDTTVDNQGNIIKDKHIKIKSLTIYHLFFQEKEFYSIDFDPYFGFNNVGQELYIPLKQQWPQWYLTIRKKINEMSKSSS